jgi:hypothetical protein
MNLLFGSIFAKMPKGHNEAQPTHIGSSLNEKKITLESLGKTGSVFLL